MDNSVIVKKKKLQAGLALLALSAVIVGTVIATPTKAMIAMQSTASTTSTPAPATSQAAPISTPSTPGSSVYKNGSYKATGNYFSPAGQESVTLTVTLANDVVTTSNVQSGANDPTAMTYQTSFISGYKQFVVGKKISSIKLSNVSGSSLTSQGFNDAIKQIEKQAKA